MTTKEESILAFIIAVSFILALVMCFKLSARDKKIIEMQDESHKNYIECIKEIPNPDWCFDKFIKVTQ